MVTCYQVNSYYHKINSELEILNNYNMSGGFLAFRCNNYNNTAEREQFRYLCEKMKSKYSKSERFYLLIGNYNIFDCELDAIIIKYDAIIAVEFKNYGGNIIACENGDWTSNGTVIKGGSRKTVYQQARINHSSLRNGLKDLGIERSWIKDIPTLVVFNQSISLNNQLSGKVRSWLYVTDNDHFIDKIEDITCTSTSLSNLDIINLAIKINLNSFLIEELSDFSNLNGVISEKQSLSSEDRQEASATTDDNFEEVILEPQGGIKDNTETYDRFTPHHIFNLRPNQVFVFGTDRNGSQRYGAAGLAARKFGAQVGVIDGPTGNCYALPTKGFNLADLQKAVERFIDYVKANNQLTFLVTPVGCGHAGFDAKQVANLFKDLVGVKNVMLPDVFIKEYHTEPNNERCQTNGVKGENELLGKRVDSANDNTLIYDKRLNNVIRYLIANNINFNSGERFVIKDELGSIIAEAELCIESEKAVFFPFNIQSERTFKNYGFTIWTPTEYLQSKAK